VASEEPVSPMVMGVYEVADGVEGSGGGWAVFFTIMEMFEGGMVVF